MLKYLKKITMKIEPGRYIVGSSGTLLTTITNISKTPSKKFVGVDSGFNHFIRPILYGAFHEIINASKISGLTEEVVVVGNICESGDIFSRTKDSVIRSITEPKIGDCIAIMDTGAYGYSMSHQFNTRPRPPEVLLDGNKITARFLVN